MLHLPTKTQVQEHGSFILIEALTLIASLALAYWLLIWVLYFALKALLYIVKSMPKNRSLRGRDYNMIHPKIIFYGLCGPTLFAWCWLIAICLAWGLVLLSHIWPSLDRVWPTRGMFGFWFGWFMTYYSL
jgi:hypothetical protein